MKKLIIATLALSVLSGAAMAGGSFYDKDREYPNCPKLFWTNIKKFTRVCNTAKVQDNQAACFFSLGIAQKNCKDVHWSF